MQLVLDPKVYSSLKIGDPFNRKRNQNISLLAIGMVTDKSRILTNFKIAFKFRITKESNREIGNTSKRGIIKINYMNLNKFLVFTGMGHTRYIYGFGFIKPKYNKLNQKNPNSYVSLSAERFISFVHLILNNSHILLIHVLAVT